MGQYFQVNGDYNIKCRDGGTITLDSGLGGDVTVVGNLTVGGIVTAVTSTELEIEDRIITVNKGETGPGVSNNGFGRYAGLEVDRGTYLDSTFVPKAAIVWNETNPTLGIADDTEEDPLSGSGFWMFATSTSDGAYGFTDSNLKLRRILTDAATDSGDLTLIGAGTGVVKVKGTTDYRLQVTDADDIPNKDYVDYSIQNNPTFQIRKEDTRLIIADLQVQVPGGDPETAGSVDYYNDQTGGIETESIIGLLVDGAATSSFYSDRVIVQDIEIAGSEIYVKSAVTALTDADIYIRTDGTGKLKTNYAFQITTLASTNPGSVSGSHVIYAKTPNTTQGETGDTGLFFATTTNRDELVSKSRALVWSMIF